MKTIFKVGTSVRYFRGYGMFTEEGFGEVLGVDEKARLVKLLVEEKRYDEEGDYSDYWVEISVPIRDVYPY